MATIICDNHLKPETWKTPFHQPMKCRTVIYNRPASQHDVIAFGETSIPQAVNP
jgi:hypothetical protein